MKKFMLCLLFTAMMAVTGCANMTPKPAQTTELTAPITTTVIIPNDPSVDTARFRSLEFSATWGQSYYKGSISKQHVIRIKNKTDKTFDFDRRIDNGISGSGIMYTVAYSIVTNGNNTVLTFKPTKYRTYQEGLIMPFAVPEFTENDFSTYIASNSVYYKLEIDSQYNTESIFANFKRLATEEHLMQGVKDTVTGKIFKNRFSIPTKNGKVVFSLETYPYRNGSKAVIYLNVPGYLTSDSTADFNMILSEIKAKLESIVNS
jgi:hypothetical protein